MCWLPSQQSFQAHIVIQVQQESLREKSENITDILWAKPPQILPVNTELLILAKLHDQ